MKVESNKYVTLAYNLHVGEGDERELMEQATVDSPLEFIFGTNSMLEAFEQKVEGLSKGDTFSFLLTPDEAYGDYEEEKIVELPIDIFQVEGKIDHEMLFEGNTLPMMDSYGNRLNGSVVSVNDTMVTMDFNHPLAGEILHFDGSVLGVRDASAEELTALFTTAGCGCGSDDCDDSEGCDCGSHDHSHHHHGNGEGGCGCGC
ncbi:FKBP-type peptidyl-prolyl cis-trans isomerase [Limibacterium fermenti]|uniref:FKBP-type peptidyl-prolyl cis-trans isomerase n=1 Tax=Limibacterium fermenti TaxID=3229863 RepID=UPI003A5D80D4